MTPLDTKQTPEKICADFKALILTAKYIATSVTISSIPPRDDNQVDSGKLKHLNGLLRPIANEENVQFVNHDKNFRYRDNTAYASLFLNKLLLNLGLSDKAKAKLGHQQHPLSQQPSPRLPLQLKDIQPLIQLEASPPSVRNTVRSTLLCKLHND